MFTTIIQFLKLVVQVYGIVRTLVTEWNQYQENRRMAEVEKRQQERKEIEKELLSEKPLSPDEKRRLLDRLNDNSF
jgi:hypothetical protein